MKFTFKSKQHGFGSPETTVEFEVDQLEDVVYYFEDFLRGCGYRFDGKLDFVYDNDNETTYEDDQEIDFSHINLDTVNVDISDYQINPDVTSPMTFSWTADQLTKMPEKFVVNPSESKVDYSVTGQGKHINLTINEEVTSLTKTICPVCKLDTKTMQNYTCYDINCGMKS